MRYILILACAAVLGACSESSGLQTYEFGIPVESIEAPDSIGPQDTLTVRLLGQIGNSDCFSFSHIEDGREAGRLELAAIGRAEISSGVRCRQVDVMLDEEYDAPPPFTDPFRVVVHQPDGDSLVHEVIVR